MDSQVSGEGRPGWSTLWPDETAQPAREDAAGETEGRILALETDMFQMQQAVQRLIQPRQQVLLETLAPSALTVMRPFHVTVSVDEEGHQAEFHDANLMAFGDTEPEALWNLKDLIALTFERLCELPGEQLGPGPARQLAVLKSFIRAPA